MFVLDNSVTMRWQFPSLKQDDQDYAKTVLSSLQQLNALVPNLWHLEVINVLLAAEKRGEATTAQTLRFTGLLSKLPIETDPHTAAQTFTHTVQIARNYTLSSYDAAYLELALRKNIPLATLDKGLRKAALDAEVELYLV